MQDDTFLNELDKEEMWDVMRFLIPHLTREEYDRNWVEHHNEQDEKRRLRSLH